MRAYDRPDLIKTETKSINDYVTNVDREAEHIIVSTLQKTFPDHAFITEESGNLGSPDAEYQWIIDPLDGTLNFTRGIPHFSVAIACQHKGRLVSSIVYDPVRQEEFTASKGEGGYVNRTRLRVSSQTKISESVMSWGGRMTDEMIPKHTRLMQTLLEEKAILRETGSACLDLAYLAAGRLDVVWMHRLKHWDMAAGLLLLTEAGGLAGDFSGGNDHIQSGNLLAATPGCFRILAPLLKKNLT